MFDGQSYSTITSNWLQSISRWFNDHLKDNNLLDMAFYSDKAWAHLSDYVNSENYRTCTALV